MSIQQVKWIDKSDKSNCITASVYAPQSPDPISLVLLPFWGGTAETYRKVQQTLIQELPACPSIAISYRGTGDSVNKDLDNDHRNYSISNVARDLARFLKSDELGNLIKPTNIVICGHSWSAKVALAFTIREAQQAGIHVNSLLYLGPSPMKPIILEAEDRKYRRNAYNSIETARFTIKNVLSHSIDDLDAETLAAGMVNMSKAAKRGWIDVGIWEDWTRDVEDFKQQLRIRVLVGDKDKVEPVKQVEKTVSFLQAQKYDVELTELQNCGHMYPLEKPGDIVESFKALLKSQETYE